MSVSTEVQRTLVKSPPELWTELSNPASLARHLAELGEIRITAVEPETKVEWETDGATGVVHLKQSGWGTKVTLSLTRDTSATDEQQPTSLAESESEAAATPVAESEGTIAPVAEPEETITPLAESEPESTATTPKPEPGVLDTEPDPEALAGESEQSALTGLDPKAAPEPVSATTPVEPEPKTADEPEPQPGFFARLFRRRRAKPSEAVEPASLVTVKALEPEPQPLATGETRKPAPEIVALAAPEPIYIATPVEPDPAPAELAADLATELEAVEAQMAQEATELLTGVLDRLGAAHHRPFSRG
jgi:hypothetical protein